MSWIWVFYILIYISVISIVSYFTGRFFENRQRIHLTSSHKISLQDDNSLKLLRTYHNKKTADRLHVHNEMIRRLKKTIFEYNQYSNFISN